MASIHLFFNGDSLTDEELQKRNGDVIISNPNKASVKFTRNGIWYLTIVLQESLLNGKKISPEAIFRVDLGYIDKQLFRVIYPKYDKMNKTYECYCNHVFFDSNYECVPIDTTHKCNNPDDSAYNDRWTWDRCIEEINTIISNSKGTSHSYKVIGISPEPEYFDDTPEVGELFYIFWRDSPDLNKCWDVKGGSGESSTPIQMYYRYGGTWDGFNPSQVFAITPSKSGIDGEYNIRNYKSYLYTNINGAVAKDGATIMIYAKSKDAAHERFKFKKVDGGGCNIVAAMDESFVISRGQANWTDSVQLCLRSIDNPSNTGFTYLFSYARFRVVVDFNNQNIVSSLFGASDNSMTSAFSKAIENTHTTAMFSNYTCYFGNMERYPETLKPKEIVVSHRYVSQDTSTVSTEERVDAIIPTGANNRRAPSSDSRSFVKSTDYDKHSVHHVAYVTYDDIGLVDDGGVITSEDALWSALEGRAKADIENGNMRFNKTESDLSIVDIITSGSPLFKGLKLNDVLYKMNEDGTREKYYIEQYEYDPINGKITNIELIKEGE